MNSTRSLFLISAPDRMERFRNDLMSTPSTSASSTSSSAIRSMVGRQPNKITSDKFALDLGSTQFGQSSKPNDLWRAGQLNPTVLPKPNMVPPEKSKLTFKKKAKPLDELRPTTIASPLKPTTDDDPMGIHTNGDDSFARLSPPPPKRTAPRPSGP